MITLATLKDATAQQVFDQVRTHLLTQMKKSGHVESGELLCFYRSGENNQLKCAAGCLIADEEYVKEMDAPFGLNGTSWDAIIEAGHAPSTHKVLITQLQWVHDSFLPSQWSKKLEELAEEFGLEVNDAA